MSPTAPNSPPRAPPAKYHTPLGTRWQKEKAAAGSGAFDYPEDAKYVGPWVIGECVGKGASGHVKIARHRRTGQLAAVKILPLQPFVNSRASLASKAKSDKQRLGVDREITMMKLMNHPNIMRIYDVYEGEMELYLILEYVEGGELFDFLVNRGKLPPLEALAYFKQIIYGLNYAHTFSIIHRDLKPENILIHSLNPPLIKIADWGMAAFAPPTLQLETSCGSPHYASPEIVNGHKYCGTATDIWSCGVILYALLTGRLPFDDKNVRTLLGKVKLGKYDMPSFVDPLAKDLLSRMLVVDVSRRISMAEILAHPWLEGLTPGITYVPAPSVSELAQPLPSALHIDRDLFESLCVIWGRHADIEGIRADLLSVPGRGTLAKAFYFLLQKHREKAMEEHGILMDIDEIFNAAGKVVTKQYAAPRSAKKPAQTHPEPHSNVGAESQIPYPLSTRVAPGPPRSQSPNARALAIVTDVPLERPVSRSIPSPIGPRPQRPRPASAIAAGRNSYVAPAGTFTPNPQEAQRFLAAPDAQNMFVYPQHRAVPPPMVRGPAMSPPGSAVPGPAHGHHRSSLGGTLTDVIHSPVPMAAGALPMISAPKVPDAALQRTFDEYATMVNMQAASWNARAQVQTQEDEGQRGEHRRAPSTTAPRYSVVGSANGNKENWDAGSAAVGRRLSAHAEGAYTTGGLGFGHSVPMAKEMGNMLFINEPGAVGKEHKKEARKSRPATMDLQGPPVLQKRATLSVIGSPRPPSPPNAAVLVNSPVVGEFKGWFSNLFHWKVQSYLLYSTNDVVATRSETTRLLAQLGVMTVLEEYAGWSVLKCRLDEPGDGAQKQMRFRVEFSGAPGTQAYSQPGTTPRLSQIPPSPRTSTYAMPRVSAVRLEGGRAGGFETTIGLVLEKGAVSTFKMIYHRLRGEWRLDTLHSPRTVAGGGGVTPNLEPQRFVA
ncbi:kinase-like domain-containing protein [Sparassis latifolia]